MISSKDIEDYSYLVSARFEAINTHYLKLIAKQINEIGRLGPANLHRLQQMAKYNQNIEEINNLLTQETNRTLQELYQVYDMSGFSLYGDYAKLFKANGRIQIPFKDNMPIQGYLNSVKQLTQGTFYNMANTTVASHTKYKDLIDTAIDAIATGQTDYNSMIRNQLLTIADEGLTVTYASGYTRRLDSAVRMNVLEGVRKVNEGVRQASGEQFGADGVEVSVHALCAKDHIDIQGKQYAKGESSVTIDGKTYEGYDAVNGALRRKIGTCNCKHTTFPIILGISEPAYTDEELKQYKANSEKQVTLTTGYDADGTPKTKTMTKYEATQYQRQLETEIRKAKDRHILAENAGDKEGAKQAKDRILALRKSYKRISEEAGLTPKWDRTFVAGYTGKQTTPKPITLNYKNNLSLDNINEIFGIDINKKHFENFSEDFKKIIPKWANDIKNSKVPDFEELMEYYSKVQTPQDRELLQFIAPLNSNVQTYQHFSEERKKYQAEIFSVLSKEHNTPLFRGESGVWVEHYGDFVAGKQITFESLSFTSPIKDATPSKHSGVLFEFESGTKSINFPGQDMLDDDELILGNFIITNVSKTNKGVPLVRLKQVK